MSVEWIEGRTIYRGDNIPHHTMPPRVAKAPSLLKQAAESQSDDGPETPAFPSFVPHFVTETGDLKPLTDDTLAEIESIIEAYQHGQTPEGYQPEVEAITGERMALTPSAIADLARLAQNRNRSEAPRAEGPRAGAPSTRDLPPEYVPFFDTETGEMPPIIEVEDAQPLDADDELDPDDVVDAEWVVDIGEKLSADHPIAGRARRPGMVTMQLMEAVRQGRYGATGMFDAVLKRRWGAKQIAILLAVIALVALAIFVPANFDRLGGWIGGDGDGSGVIVPTLAPGESPQPTYVIITGDAPTPAPPADPTATPRPTEVGQVAYASNVDGDFEIFVLSLQSGDLRQITDNPAADRSPSLSPDGSRVVFVSDRAGDDDLYVMDADGGNLTRLTTSSASDRSPRWSPDGGSVVFTRETVDGSALVSFEVGCIAIPETCENVLTMLSEGRYDLDPAWSPDASRIVFGASDFPGQPSVLALLDPVSDTFDTLEGTGASDFDPAWSPDGGWLAFSSNLYEDYDLWLVGVDGLNPRQLTRGDSSEVQPAWSPAGGWLVFASDVDGDFELYLIEARCALEEVDDPNACEADATRLTDNDADDLDPNWGR